MQYFERMKILAFETSCDDTGVALVENGTKILAATRMSQLEHAEFGGVVPEIASRLHAENLFLALEQTLASANLKISDVDQIAVTAGPGLSPALLSGTTAASFLALFYSKPLARVHHIFGHLCSVFLERNLDAVRFPALVLTVSGGHTQMHLWRSVNEIQTLGSTIDDAAGEAFDKVAKMTGLGYPGGPEVSAAAAGGDENTFAFPRILLGRANLDFSFSGLKGAVFREVEKEKNCTKSEKLSPKFVANVCASFENTVAEIFEKKVSRAFDRFPEIQQVIFVGGVSANRTISARLQNLSQTRKKGELLRPKKMSFCTDNAEMIGSAAFFQHEKNPAKIQFVDANARLESWFAGF